MSVARKAAKVNNPNYVSNTPYRRRLEWLLQNTDIEVSLVCRRLGELGMEGFVRPNGRPETSWLLRSLGMKRHAGSNKNGVRYQAVNFTEHITVDLANALYTALEMDPLIEEGQDPLPRRERLARTCRWGEGCDEPSGHGQFGRFCATHAEELAKLRMKPVSYKRKGKKLRAMAVKGRDGQRSWAEEIWEQVA
jgi:hypothetical protein